MVTLDFSNFMGAVIDEPASEGTRALKGRRDPPRDRRRRYVRLQHRLVCPATIIATGTHTTSSGAGAFGPSSLTTYTATGERAPAGRRDLPYG